MASCVESYRGIDSAIQVGANVSQAHYEHGWHDVRAFFETRILE